MMFYFIISTYLRLLHDSMFVKYFFIHNDNFICSTKKISLQMVFHCLFVSFFAFDKFSSNSDVNSPTGIKETYCVLTENLYDPETYCKNGKCVQGKGKMRKGTQHVSGLNSTKFVKEKHFI